MELNEKEVLLAEYRRQNRQLAQSVSDNVRIITDVAKQNAGLRKLLKSKNIEIPSELT
jgi:hypothetical protein